MRTRKSAGKKRVSYEIPKNEKGVPKARNIERSRSTTIVEDVSIGQISDNRSDVQARSLVPMKLGKCDKRAALI